jgi:hypothetical protein
MKDTHTHTTTCNTQFQLSILQLPSLLYLCSACILPVFCLCRVHASVETLSHVLPTLSTGPVPTTLD